MKIAVFSTKSFDREYFEKYNTSGKIELKYLAVPLNKDTANLTQGFDGVCVFVNDKLDKETIAVLAENGVRLIVLRCAGFNNVDLETAAEKNIQVLRVPAYSPEAVAEHALALILTLNRKTHKAYNRIRENNFSLEKLTGFNLSGKTVGVIGTGRIGSIFCKIMKGIGCEVIACDVVKSHEVSKLGIMYVSLDELLEKSDIVSLHCPLNLATQHLINKEKFNKMKKGAMLINTSRGALINTKDAVEALKASRLGYLGLDVYEQEEHLFFRDLSEHIIQDDLIARLMTFPNVLITAHQGFFTKEALVEITTTTLKNIMDFENGIASENEVKLGKKTSLVNS